jgi:hypothetical protein
MTVTTELFSSVAEALTDHQSASSFFAAFSDRAHTTFEKYRNRKKKEHHC